MSRQEGLVTVTVALQRLQFTGHIHLTFGIIAYVEGYHSDRVTGNEKLILLGIIEGKGKDSADVFEEMDSFLPIECEDDLTVATGLELVLVGILAPDGLMIIYLTIDGQHLFFVGTEKRLFARFGIDNGKSFMRQDG